jgi:non-ribosomal peptide synthetase component E (peptide arylation enzyme)
MMSGVLSESPGASGSEAAAGKVFRSELNPVDLLHRAAYIYPEKIAVVDGDRRYSYADLSERSWRLANALRSAGLGKGDRVAALLFNSSAMLEAHFGVPAAGGVLVRSTTACPARRSGTSWPTAARSTCCSMAGSRRWPRRWTWPA